MNSLYRTLRLDLVHDRHIIFATDVVHFLSNEYQLRWLPDGCRYYQPHALSPFTRDMGEAIRVILRDREREFRIQFQELVAPVAAEDQETAFVEHSKNVFYRMFHQGCVAPQLFETIVYVARMSTLFYERGFVDVPNSAVVLISEAIFHFMSVNGAGLYCTFSEVASEIISCDD